MPRAVAQAELWVLTLATWCGLLHQKGAALAGEGECQRQNSGAEAVTGLRLFQPSF